MEEVERWMPFLEAGQDCVLEQHFGHVRWDEMSFNEEEHMNRDGKPECASTELWRTRCIRDVKH